jgi:HupE / UreJ protein
MSSFGSFLALGLQHILALSAADHLLFLATLVLAYEPGKWKPLLILVGHSLTLTLAMLNVVPAHAAAVERMIPATIIVASVANLWAWRQARRVNDPPRRDDTVLWPRFGVALFFGLIHGLGFSTALRTTLGATDSRAVPLLAFSIGIELAQIVVLCVLAMLGALLTWQLFDRRGYVLIASGITLGCAMQLLIARL